MGQDISVSVKITNKTRAKKLLFYKGGRAKHSFIDSGVELREFIEEIFEDFFININKEGVMHSTSSRDFEKTYRVFKKIGKESKEAKFEGFSQNTSPQWFTPFEVEYNSYLTFVGVNKYGSDTISFYYEGLDESEIKMFQLIALEALAEEFTEVYTLHEENILGHNGESVLPKDVDTSILEGLGFEFPIKPIETPYDMKALLGAKASSYGNTPDGENYFGIGGKTVAVYEKYDVDSYIKTGKFAMWEKNGEKYIFFDNTLDEKIAIGLVIGVINLDNFTKSNTNDLYNKAFQDWLKANEYVQYGRDSGIGIKKIHRFMLNIDLC